MSPHSSRSSSKCLSLLHRLLVPSVFPWVTRFRTLLRKMWPILLTLLRFIACRMCPSSLAPHNTFAFFRRSVQRILTSLSNTTFQSFQGTSDLFSSPYTTMLQCSISLVSSLISNPICWWNECTDSTLLYVILKPWIQEYLIWLHRRAKAYSC